MDTETKPRESEAVDLSKQDNAAEEETELKPIKLPLAPQESKKGLYIVIAVVVILVIAGGVVAFILLTGNKKDATDTKASSATTSANIDAASSSFTSNVTNEEQLTQPDDTKLGTDAGTSAENVGGSINETIFKLTAAIVMALASVVATPVSTFALETKSAACTTFSTLQTKYDDAVSKSFTTMTTDFDKRIDTINNRSTTVDPKVDAAREKAAAAFDKAIDKLKAQPGLTSMQQRAIDNYSKQMKAAENTREQAVDAARDTYRTSLVTIVKQHQAKLTNAATTFKDSVSTAFTTAATNCSDDTAKDTLKTSVATARTSFASARNSAEVTDQIKAVAKTRNDSIKAVDTAFAKSAASLSATLSATLDVVAN